MRRMSLLLALTASLLTVISGSALAAAGRSAASPPVNSSTPTISGTAQDGQTLTATNGSWAGVTPITYAYQWQRCNSSGSSCDSIAMATGQNYVVSHGDVGGTIRVQVTATNSDGTAQALSAATATIADLGSAPVNTMQPNPSGTPTAGQTVTVDNGRWAGLMPIAFTYQWQTCTAESQVCTDLAGATAQSYQIASTQVGSLLRATVTATNSLGNTKASSNLTTAVLAAASAPVNTSLPTISGPASPGQTLQVSTGGWTGVAANAFAYQWSRCNAGGTSCASISGATGQSYGVGQADLGTALRVTVTGTNPSGSTNATSAALSIAAPIVQTAKFNAVLRPNQEISRPTRTSTLAAGHFTAKVAGKTLTWTLTFSHLNGRPTAVTLNKGARRATGVAFKTLCRECTSPRHGTLTLTASQLDALLSGGTYVNIHTVRNSRGEIRGQINRVS
jgi:hypothetical protein